MADNTEPGISQDPVNPTPQDTANPTPAEPQFTDREKQYYARIKKLEEENEAFKKAATSPDPKPSNPEPTGPKADFDTLATFVEATRDLQPAELNELRSEAKELGIDPMKFIASKSGKAHLEKIRATAKSTGATPSPSNKVRTFNGKPVDDVFKDPSASPVDKQKAFEEKMRRGTANSAI